MSNYDKNQNARTLTLSYSLFTRALTVTFRKKLLFGKINVFIITIKISISVNMLRKPKISNLAKKSTLMSLRLSVRI